MDLVDRLRLETPVIQAGMGGGLATAELAAAVSSAGALGTVGLLPDSRAFAAEVRRAHTLASGRPIAANLLLPFTRLDHVLVCIEELVDLVVLFCGFAPRYVARLREAGILVFQQVGTVEEARRAIADGVDGLIAQGNEAGGHLLGVEPTVTFLAKALEVAGGRPVLAAGGVATAQDTRQLLDAGAEAVVAGTRFLLTEECRAHRTYKQRVLDAEQTLETKLFSVGWIDRHRVVPNAATQRWCSAKPDGPRAVLAANRVLAPVLQRLPAAAATASLKLQRTGVPFFGPGAALEGMPESVVDVTPLYAGESALGIDEVLPAARAVELLAP